jgi:ribosome-binding ATPase YchF (GTP1/OBG family)
LTLAQAAGTIHTDFERGFICAEVMSYDELKELGSEAAVKAAGKYRQEVRAHSPSPPTCVGARFGRLDDTASRMPL